MKTKLISLLLPIFMFVSCEDEVQEASACASIIANAEQTIEAAKEIDLPILWFWPNIDAGANNTSGALRTYRELSNPKNIHFFKNMEGRDFLKLLYKLPNLEYLCG